MRHSEYYERPMDAHDAGDVWMGEHRLNNLYTGSDYFVGPTHNERVFQTPEEEEYRPTWRLKDRLKTSGVALVMCLNIGTDPPNVVKPNPCARKQCWLDPSSATKQKSLEIIGNALQQQYEKLQSKSKYKQCLDPTSEDLRRVCCNLRKQARGDRLLLHYNGHGVPRPTANGELWTFGKNYTFYMPVSVLDIKSWFGEPAIYVIDCSGAGVVVPFFVDAPKQHSESSDFFSNESILDRTVGSNVGIETSGSIVLAACRAEETLPMNPQYPADIFTSCLTTPITICARWFMINNPHSMSEISLDLAENLPGKETERKSPRGDLYWIFTAITDTIAWSILPPHVFQKMFRQDLLVASLFRNFLLAKRLMKGMRCNPQSNPPLPDCSSHPLWQVWDFALESGLLQTAAEMKGILRSEPQMSPWYVDVGVVAGGSGSSAYIDRASALVGGGSNSANSGFNSISAPFFADMLTAFEIWLDFGGGARPSDTTGDEEDDSLDQASHFPLYLPIILQILLSQTYRARALNLLLRYISKGYWAVNSALLVGIYPYIIKLLPAASAETRQSLVAIWTYIIAFDHGCRVDLVKDKHHASFISWMRIDMLSVTHRCMSAFIVCEICNSFREGQQVCLNSALHKTINQLISQADVLSSSMLKRWVSLCLGKLCEDFVLAKYMFMSEVGHLQFHQLLVDQCPLVRAAVVSSLGELFGASQGNLTQGNNSSASTPFRHPGIRQSGGIGSGMGGPTMVPPLSSDGQPLSMLNLPPAFGGGGGSMLPPPAPSGGLYPSPSMTPIGGPATPSNSDFCTAPTPGATRAPYANRAAVEQLELRRSELQLALHILDRLNDGSAMVRREAAVALSKLVLVPIHWPCIRLVARFILDYHGKLFSISACPTQTDTSDSGDKGRSASRTVSAPIPMAADDKSASSRGSVSAAADAVSKESGGTSGQSDPATSKKHMTSYQNFPWLLPSAEQKALTAKVENLLIEEGVLSILSGGLFTKRSETLAESEDPEIAGYLAVISSIAASYLRLWLSLREIQYKDAHPRVVKAMTSVINYVHAQMEVDDANLREEQSDEWGVNSGGSSHSSVAVSGMSTPKRGLSPGKLTIKTSHSPMNSPKGSPSLPGYDGACGDHPATGKGTATNWLLMNSDTMSVAACMASDPSLQSSVYQWSKNLFLQPDTSIDDDGDPLSKRGQELLYKERELNNTMELAKKISNKYRIVDSKSGRYSFERTADGGDGSAAPAQAASPLPNSLSNFQPKAIITVQNSEMTTHVMFHGYKDVLAVCDGVKVGLWSLENGSKLGSVDRKVVRNTNLTAHYACADACPHVSTTPTLSRITSLNWINQSNDSLMLTGADDGTVHIWRDNLGDDLAGQTGGARENSDDISPTASGTRAVPPSGSGGANKVTPSLAAAFTALPDIAASSRGSGMIADWQQHSGVLAVGGNSETIRLWDVNKEQCSRVLHTGTNKCMTAISTQSVAWRNGYGDGSDGYPQPFGVTNCGRNDPSTSYWSWIVAGFGDGSVGVFDEKVHTQGGRVHSAREDNHWIVQTYIREDVPEVIVGALYGGVKFWDLRTMRVFKTIEVHKSPLTAMSIHNCAPVMATGSHKQFIKILTLSGDLLSMIRYHDGFLGQRIAPVSCLAFHPHKMLLAAGSTDHIVAIYAPTEAF